MASPPVEPSGGCSEGLSYMAIVEGSGRRSDVGSCDRDLDDIPFRSVDESCCRRSVADCAEEESPSMRQE